MKLYQQNSNFIYGALIILGLILLSIWLFEFKVTGITTYSQFDTTARQNDHLAASMFITATQGIEFKKQHKQQIKQLVEVQPTLALINDLPDINDTIIITTTRESLTEIETAHLYDWVSFGGHLIVEYRHQEDHENLDLLLNPEGITVEKWQDPNAKTVEEAIEDFDQQQQNDKQEINKTTKDKSFEITQYSDLLTCPEQNADMIAFPTEQLFPFAKAQILTDSHLIIDEQTEPSLQLGNHKGIQFVQLAIGSGMLTAMSDLTIWENTRIHCFDHAYLLHQLTTQDKRQGKVWFLTQEQYPTLIELLFKYHKTLIISAFAALILWIWSQTLRYGPIHAIERSERREYMEHLTASARYQFNHGGKELLVDKLRQNINHLINIRHNGFNHLNQDQQIELVIKLTDMPKQDIDLALYQPAASKTEQILTQIQLAQQIRKNLC